MSSDSHCRLRTHRRLWGLTQQELAGLVGCRCATNLSRIERGERTPRIEVALACEVIFGVPPREMFPNLHERIEEAVMRRASALHERLEKQHSMVAAHKRELLQLALKRAVKKK